MNSLSGAIFFLVPKVFVFSCVCSLCHLLFDFGSSDITIPFVSRYICWHRCVVLSCTFSDIFLLDPFATMAF